MLAEVRGAGEGEGMALHPGQHLVDLAHLPAPVRVSSVAEQRVRFVEDEECLRVAGLGERGRDLLLGLADPGREQVGRALLEDLEPEALGEVARERALAGAGRTLEAEREAPVGVPHEALGEGDRIGIGLDEAEVEPRRRTLRRPFAPEHPGEAPDPVAHRVDAPARESGGGGRPGPHPGGDIGLARERVHVFIRGLDAVARELPHPDPGPHPGASLSSAPLITLSTWSRSQATWSKSDQSSSLAGAASRSRRCTSVSDSEPAGAAAGFLSILVKGATTRWRRAGRRAR